MSDQIKVKPLRTFDLCDGSGVRTSASEPFMISRGTAAELMANGLVEIVEDKPKAEAKSDDKPRRKGASNEAE